MADLEELLSGNLRRRVTREELSSILGISVATYARRKANGYPADDVIKIARHFGLPPTLLLVDAGVLEPEDVGHAVHQLGLAGISDVDILEELLGRAQDRMSGRLDDATRDRLLNGRSQDPIEPPTG